MEFWGNSYSFSSLDPNAAAYIAAVQAADGQALEAAVASAINAFVVGCKADGIWNAIQASCILAGARTLSGALVPLAGAAPTNFNFVAGDYNRKTGLKGDGSTKYLNCNRINSADPPDSKHLAVLASTIAFATGANPVYLDSGWSGTANSGIAISGSTSSNGAVSVNGAAIAVSNFNVAGFIGCARISAAQVAVRGNNTTGIYASTRNTPGSNNTLLMRDTASTYSNARIAFYSIGESLNLALLDARVTALINALAAAIP